MKKIFVSFLTAAFIMSLMACGTNSNDEAETDTSTMSVEAMDELQNEEEPLTESAGETVENTKEEVVKTNNSDSKLENKVTTVENTKEKEESVTAEANKEEKNEVISDESKDADHTHSYSSTVVTKATCTEDGYTAYRCACGEAYRDDYVEYTGHEWSEWITVKKATIFSKGTAERSCEKCGSKESKKIPKEILGHTHSYAVTVTKEATCSAKGEMTFTCSCGNSYVESIEKLDHVRASELHSPTCTEEGYTLHNCPVCGYSYKDKRVPALGHKFVFEKDTATCVADGVVSEFCRVCGDTKTSVSKAYGHKVKQETAEASCIFDGYVREKCETCNDIVSETRIPSLGGHTYETKRLSDAVNEYIEQYDDYYYVQYANYTDWNVDMCSMCDEIDLESARFAYTDYEAAVIMLGYVNDLRESVYGTSDYNLTLDASLVDLANIRSEEISVDFSHWGGTSHGAENIAGGGISIYDDFMMWYNSPGHYNNMIHQSHTTFGYANYKNPYGLFNYSVQLFG